MKLQKDIKEIMTNKIDLQILKILLAERIYLRDLPNKIGIAYKNLLPHIRKLENAGLIGTKKQKHTRGQKVLIHSMRDEGRGKNLIGPEWKDIFRGKTGNKAKKEILEVIRGLNKKTTLEAISYLTDMSVRHVWKHLIEDLLNEGYVQAKFEITKEGEKYLEGLMGDK